MDSFQTLHDDVSGAAFHPLDDNLLITHGKGHLTFWTRRKDGFFERTDIIKPVGQDRIEYCSTLLAVPIFFKCDKKTVKIFHDALKVTNSDKNCATESYNLL